MLSQYITRDEIGCPCGCGFDAIDTELNDILLDLREHFGKPITIHSANRCITHNHAVGGKINSYHVRGRAADFHIKDIHIDEIGNYLDNKYPYRYGIGRYHWGVHVDTRDKKTRWDMRH